eukprot:Pgem_evm1s10368
MAYFFCYHPYISLFMTLGSIYFAYQFLFKKEEPVKAIKIELKKYEQDEIIDAPVHEEMLLNDPEKPGKLQCYDPCTMQHLGEVDAMTKEQVDDCVARAAKAQKEWAKTSMATRIKVMKMILKYFVENQEDIVRVSVRDSGKTKLGAVLGEITPTCEKLRWIIKYGEDILKPETRGGQGLLTLHKHARVEYVPVGVLGVLAPFNYPCHNLLNHIISGLFSGNASVTKVSEYTSWSADFYLRSVHAALREVGHSPDLAQVVTGFGPTGAALVASDVNKIIFTGSDKVGKLVMKGAADKLTPVVLELGGKDPFIICKDVDLDWIKQIALRGVFQNNGQNCIGIERIYVEEAVYEEFVKKVLPIIKEMRQGQPLTGEKDNKIDTAAMCMPAQITHIEALVADAKEKGANVLIGGERNTELGNGLFYKPTLITGITPDMRIAKEEVFGPVMAIVPWKTEDELLNIVNTGCPYGLGSSVFTNDRTRALRIANQIESGMTNINDFGINYLCQSLPFGGVKSSGFGRFAGPEGLRACCHVKSITEDRFPGVKTSLPPAFCYPVSCNSPAVASSLIEVAFESSWGKWAMSVVELLKGLAGAKRV